MTERSEQIIEFLKAQRRPVRYAELRAVAKAAKPIQDLVDAGAIVRLPMGNYGLPDRDATYDLFAQLSLRHPEAVICLKSAAAFHSLSTVNPQEVHAAFAIGTTIPRHRDMPIQGYRWSIKNLEFGVENIEIGGVEVRMTTKARTVIDLLSRIGRTGEAEEALETLNNFVHSDNPSDLLKLATRMGKAEKIAPYVQAAIATRGMRHG